MSMRYLIALLLAASTAYALPDRPAPEKKAAPAPVKNYSGAVVTWDSEGLSIDDGRYFGSGKYDENGGIPITWIDKEKNEATHIGYCWFDNAGWLVSSWSMIGHTEWIHTHAYVPMNFDCKGLCVEMIQE